MRYKVKVIPYSTFTKDFKNLSEVVGLDVMPFSLEPQKEKLAERVVFLQDPETQAVGGCVIGTRSFGLRNVSVVRNIFFDLDEDSELHEKDEGEGFYRLLEEFYDDLYCFLERYEERHNTEIFTCLSKNEHTDSSNFGHWYYKDFEILEKNFFWAKLWFWESWQKTA